MISEKTSFKNWGKQIRKIAKKVVSKEANHKCISKEETTTSGLKETSKEDVSELPSTSQTLMRENLPQKRKSNSTQKVVSKKSVKNMRLNPRKAQIKSDHIICPQCWITWDLCDRWYDPVCENQLPFLIQNSIKIIC